MALAGLSIIAGFTLVLLSGCAAVRQALHIENPRYTIRDIRPRVDIALPLSASTIDIDFAIEVDNPNDVGLNLDQIDFNLFVNDNAILDSVRSYDVRIPAKGRQDVQLQTRIGYQNVRSLWDELVNVIRGRRAKYEIRGDAYYETPIGRMKFPVTVYSTR